MTAENKAKKDIIYADLSGKIIGILFEVYNHLGMVIRRRLIKKR
jgi:hypothetical protein